MQLHQAARRLDTAVDVTGTNMNFSSAATMAGRASNGRNRRRRSRDKLEESSSSSVTTASHHNQRPEEPRFKPLLYRDSYYRNKHHLKEHGSSPRDMQRRRGGKHSNEMTQWRDNRDGNTISQRNDPQSKDSRASALSIDTGDVDGGSKSQFVVGRASSLRSPVPVERTSTSYRTLRSRARPAWKSVPRTVFPDPGLVREDGGARVAQKRSERKQNHKNERRCPPGNKKEDEQPRFGGGDIGGTLMNRSHVSLYPPDAGRVGQRSVPESKHRQRQSYAEGFVVELPSPSSVASVPLHSSIQESPYLGKTGLSTRDEHRPSITGPATKRDEEIKGQGVSDEIDRRFQEWDEPARGSEALANAGDSRFPELEPFAAEVDVSYLQHSAVSSRIVVLSSNTRVPPKADF